MIVCCNECSARFRLDDSRVPAHGIRVRCSRCKHAFFLQPSGSSEVDALHAAAVQAASAGESPAPGTTQDLPAEAEIDRGSGEFPRFEEAEESDWQFNVEIPTPDDEQMQVPPQPAEPETGAGPLEEDAGEASGAFGSVEDFAFLAGEEGTPIEGPAAPEPSASGAPVESRDAGGTEELGDPESWNLLGEDALSHPTPELEEATPAAVASGAVIGAVNLVPGGSSSLPERAAEPALDSPLVDPVVVSRIPARLLSAGRAAGWVLVVALFGIAVLRGVSADLLASNGPPRVIPLGEFRAFDVRAHWLDTARSGTLFKVEGRLRNPTSEALAPGTRLRARLSGRTGELRSQAFASFARPVAESQLRELPLDELREATRRAAEDFGASPIPPGRSAPFQVVFDRVPDVATRFVLEVAIEPVRETADPR